MSVGTTISLTGMNFAEESRRHRRRAVPGDVEASIMVAVRLESIPHLEFRYDIRGKR